MKPLKIKLGQRRDIEVETDPEGRQAELGVSEDPEAAEDKWSGEEKPSKKEEKRRPLGEVGDDYETPETDFMGRSPSDPEYVDPGFFRIDININGRVFKLTADHLLSIRRGEHFDPQAEDFDEQLEAVSFYRFSLFSASIQVRRERQLLEQDFRRWLAKTQRAHRERLSIERKETRKEHGLTSKDQPSITKDEVLDSILTDDDDALEYGSFKMKLQDLQDKEDLLKELRDCLHDRGFHLGGIAERATQLRRKPDFD